MDGRFCRMARSVVVPVCWHSRCARMDYINHPARSRQVDSGLRRAATGFLPSRRIPDFLSVNDGRASMVFKVASLCL